MFSMKQDGCVLHMHESERITNVYIIFFQNIQQNDGKGHNRLFPHLHFPETLKAFQWEFHRLARSSLPVVENYYRPGIRFSDKKCMFILFAENKVR